MSVLGTKFTSSMVGRQGYMSIKDVLEDQFKYYTFNTCIKIKDVSDIDTWVMYWENSPVAVVLKVLPSILNTKFTKVAIISKEVVSTDDVGEYPGKSNHMFGLMYNKTKFMSKENVIAKVQRDFILGVQVDSVNKTVVKPVEPVVKYEDKKNPNKKKKFKSKKTVDKKLTDNSLSTKISALADSWGINVKKGKNK